MKSLLIWNDFTAVREIPERQDPYDVFMLPHGKRLVDVRPEASLSYVRIRFRYQGTTRQGVQIYEVE